MQKEPRLVHSHLPQHALEFCVLGAGRLNLRLPLHRLAQDQQRAVAGSEQRQQQVLLAGHVMLLRGTGKGCGQLVPVQV